MVVESYGKAAGFPWCVTFEVGGKVKRFFFVSINFHALGIAR